MIVVEGPDGSGKTTLVDHISKQYDLEIGERGTADRDILFTTTRADTWRAFETEMRCTAPPLIWDRLGPWSDPVYAPLANRATAFSKLELEHADYFIKAFRCLLIYCCPPYNTVKENVLNEDIGNHMTGVRKNISLIYRAYDRMFQERDVPVVKFNYTTTYDQDILDHHVRWYLESREEREFYARSH